MERFSGGECAISVRLILHCCGFGCVLSGLCTFLCVQLLKITPERAASLRFPFVCLDLTTNGPPKRITLDLPISPVLVTQYVWSLSSRIRGGLYMFFDRFEKMSPEFNDAHHCAWLVRERCKRRRQVSRGPNTLTDDWNSITRNSFRDRERRRLRRLN